MTTRKLLYSILAIIVLCVCSSTCFAAENGNSVTLGNEIMQSIDKTGQSFDNIVSGNIVDDTKNGVRSGVDNAKDGVDDGMNMITDDAMMMTNNTRQQDYNTAQTATEGTAQRNGMDTMTTTTWMWIILSIAAIIIIAAIWYYATQNNS